MIALCTDLMRVSFFRVYAVNTRATARNAVCGEGLQCFQ